MASFSWALEQLKAGKSVRRKYSGSYFFLRGNCINQWPDGEQLTDDDILADDWELADDRPS